MEKGSFTENDMHDTDSETEWTLIKAQPEDFVDEPQM